MIQKVPLASLQLGQLVRKPSEDAIQRMAKSLDTLEQLTPIGATSKGKVIFGVTRCLAAKKLGWETILARIFDDGVKEAAAFRMSVTENTVRSQMTFPEMADAIHQYAQLTGKPLQEAGQELGYKQPQISKCLKTDERLTPENKKRLLDAGIGGSLAYLYSQEADPAAQTALIERGIKEKWKRKDIEKHFRSQKSGRVKLEYFTGNGKLSLDVDREASPDELLSLLRTVAGDINKSAKAGHSLRTMATVLKEQSYAMAQKN